MGLSSRVKQIFYALLIIIVVGFIGLNVFRAIQRTPFFGGSSSRVLKEPIKIGVLYFRQQQDVVDGFKEGLGALGYEKITYQEILASYGPTMPADVERGARELIDGGVDLILTPTEDSAIGVLKISRDTKTSIPVVFLSGFHDPVNFDLAESFKSSGNNLAGIAVNKVEVVQKNLEFIKKINPAIKKIGIFSEGFMVPLSQEILAELKTQAQRLDYRIIEYKTSTAPPEAENEWYGIAKNIKRGEIDVIFHLAGHYFDAQEVAESALASRLGILHVVPPEDLPTGGQFGYAGDYFATGRQAAKMADKIFRGTRPSDIPIEFIDKNRLVLHLGRAAVAGIAFPDSMISIADKIIRQ